MNFEPVIGLEVHAQLATRTKIFCGCRTEFGAASNSHTCPVCLGLPGALPVLNRAVIDLTMRIGLAVESTIQRRSRFLRKNYFYPDLPKGYQISQFQSNEEMPLATGGRIGIPAGGRTKTVHLVRIHVEEDAGKSIHEEAFVAADASLVDVNRCGVPLIEIVTEPDISSPREAADFLTRLRQLLIYTGVSEGDMEKGHVRIDANVSVKPSGASRLGVKTEIKNMNSVRNCQRALESEIRRQIAILETGGKILQETLLYDADRNELRAMRNKEYSDDYRYFPDPDLVAIVVDEAWIERVKADLPELPAARCDRFVSEYGLTAGQAQLLTASKEAADYYEATVAAGGLPLPALNWVQGQVLRTLKERKISLSELRVTPQHLAELMAMVDAGRISNRIARTVFDEIAQSGEAPATVVEKKGLVQISDESDLHEIIEAVLSEHPEEVQRYQAGQKRLTGFFMGQVMKKTEGQANPKLAGRLLKEKLGS